MGNYIAPEMIADELSITAKTIREWLRTGELAGIKVGNSWRIYRSDFERFLEGKRLEMLMDRAHKKYPDHDWEEGQCGQCGVYIPVPKLARNVVCSLSCKNLYDQIAADIVGRGTSEFLDCSAIVIPHF